MTRMDGSSDDHLIVSYCTTAQRRSQHADSGCVPPPSTAARTVSDLIYVSTGKTGRDLAAELAKLSKPSDCCLVGQVYFIYDL